MEKSTRTPADVLSLQCANAGETRTLKIGPSYDPLTTNVSPEGLRIVQYGQSLSALTRDACFTSYVTAGFFRSDLTSFTCSGSARTSLAARRLGRVLQESNDEAEVEFETTFELETENYDLLTAGASVVGGAGLLIASVLLSMII